MTATREHLFEQIIELADKITAARHSEQHEYADSLQVQLNKINQEYTNMVEALEPGGKNVLKG